MESRGELVCWAHVGLTLTNAFCKKPGVHANLSYEDSCNKENDPHVLVVHRVDAQEHHECGRVDADDGHAAFISHKTRATEPSSDEYSMASKVSPTSGGQRYRQHQRVSAT